MDDNIQLCKWYSKIYIIVLEYSFFFNFMKVNGETKIKNNWVIKKGALFIVDFFKLGMYIN